MKAWAQNVGVSHTNIFNIRNGMQQFGKEHIHQACIIFNISADFLYGFTDEMFRNRKIISPLERIKEAVNELENKKQKG